MATIGDVGLAEPSTLTKRLAAVEITRNSTVQSQEMLCIADPDSTTALAIAKVSATVGLPSTTVGLAVRIAGGPSSAADLLVRPVFSSTNTDNPVRAVLSSTNTDNPVRSFLNTSSGGGVEGSSTPPPHGTFALHTRSIRPNLITVTSTAGTDTTVTLISSAATTPRILAYTAHSTEAGPIRAGFYAGSTLLWPVTLWADGGRVVDAQTGTLPGFLFTGQADRPVQFSVSSTGAFTVGLTYWAE